MKKFLYLLLILIISQGCYVTRFVPSGDYAVKTIDTPEAKGISATSNYYQDEFVGINTTVETYNFKLHLENKTDATIKVLWDNGSYVDPYGQAHRICHTGIKFIDVEKAQVPSILPAKTVIDDVIAPADYVSYEDGWTYSPLINGDTIYKTEAEASSVLVNFQPIKLLLPIEVDGSVREYLFTYDAPNMTTQEERLKDVSSTSLLIITGAAIGGGILGLLLAL